MTTDSEPTAPLAQGAPDIGHRLPGPVHEARPDGVSWYRTNKGRLVLVTGALLAAAWTAGLVRPDAGHWAFIAACVIGVFPVAKRALAAARAGMPFTIEMLMTIAATGALFIGAAEEAALVVFLFAVGEVLEGVAADRARGSIRALSDLVPKTATIEANGATWQVDAAALAIGQTLLVRPGDRIAADGEILDGVSGIDESPVTGESVPKTKGPGEPVFAGSVNREAALRVRVTKAAQDNTIARIIRLVEEAEAARAPTERFIDRFSRVYMPAVVGLALLVALAPPLLLGGEWSVWIYRALALLLIGCPCALVISVPAAIAAALSTGARQGLLMKGGVVIEAAARTGLVAFDKTGTLTRGAPERHQCRPARPQQAGGRDLRRRRRDRIEPSAGACDHRGGEGAGASGAPGRAGGCGRRAGRDRDARRRRDLRRRASPCDGAREASMRRPRRRVATLEAEGKTVVAVVADGRLAGLVALRDEPREDAAAAVAELKELGVRAMMLTGDNVRAGAAIAARLGMECKAELMPGRQGRRDQVARCRDPGDDGRRRHQ